MKTTLRTLFVATLLATTSLISAQHVQTLYFLENVSFHSPCRPLPNDDIYGYTNTLIILYPLTLQKSTFCWEIMRGISFCKSFSLALPLEKLLWLGGDCNQLVGLERMFTSYYTIRSEPKKRAKGVPLDSRDPDAFLRCVGNFHFTIQNALGAYTPPQGLCVWILSLSCFLRETGLKRFPLAISSAKILIVFTVESKTNDLIIPKF